MMPTTFHQPPATPTALTSVLLCDFFSLHMLTSTCRAHGLLLLCRLEVIWKAAWRAHTPKCSPKLHLPLCKLIRSKACDYICMRLYTCVKLKYKKSLLPDELTSAWHAWQSVSEVKYPFLITAANSSRQPSFPGGSGSRLLVSLPKLVVST